MFKRSFNKFLEKTPDKPELYPYIYSIGLSGLKTKAEKKITTEPITCSQCGAVLTNIKLIKDDSNVGTHYNCEYCGTVNVISKEHITESLPNNIDFIIEDIEEIQPIKDGKITKVETTEGELYISVIDISGSMSGAKIEAVKKSLVQTIKDFKMNSPTTKFILIAFESSVYYYLRHDKEPINFHGDLLFSLDGMKAQLEKSIKKDTMLGSIGEFADGWTQKVENLRSMDMTALGPALYFAIISFNLFQLKSSGRITLLTDGLANQGIGNLSGSSIGSEKFYDESANLCNQHNIIVDVVGVSKSGDNNEMGLQTLGKLTDKTGGKLFLISDDEMGAAFAELQQTKYIGKDVKIKIITPTNISIKNVTGAFSSRKVEESEINLGAVTEDRELFVELNTPKDFKEKESIPIQLQVNYKDEKGRKRLRVVNDRVNITKDQNEFKSEYDQKLNVMMNIQETGRGWYGGKAKESKKQLSELKAGLQNEMRFMKEADINFKEETFTEGLGFIDDDIEEMEMEEEKFSSTPKSSYMASKGQSRARISQEELKKRMKSKK